MTQPKAFHATSVTPITSTPCPSCDNPKCDGSQNELRHFEDWQDLSNHLDEATIVMFINHLASIVDEYIELKDRDSDNRLKRRAYQNKRNALINFALEQLTQDEIDFLKAQGEEQAIKTIETHHNGRVRVTHGPR